MWHPTCANGGSIALLVGSFVTTVLISPNPSMAIPTKTTSNTAATTTATTTTNEIKVIRSKKCYQGQGDGCMELAQENALIQSLQQKSQENQKRNEEESLNAYYMKNYPDYFASLGKTMIQKANGGFVLVSDGELEELKRNHQLTYEVPRTRGGTMVDMTQKPTWIMKE